MIKSEMITDNYGIFCRRWGEMMKKKTIMSKTIAMALATTNLAALSEHTVNALENNVDSVNVEINADNSLEVTIEDTDIIDNSDSLKENENVVENADEAVTGEVTEDITEDVTETVDTNNGDSIINESNEETVIESESIITDEESTEPSVSYESKGKIELDINFPMPKLILMK
ncbi:hypothetical protein H9X77_08120 [Clostridium saudiense]|nr:hypothetical protein [Clostridium saudiense]